ncbi:MAG: hypothetical protein H0Z24_08025 [Thermosipho sp. (in: Bacteria)]|nr:hypothetical protein [Thermosipho sp. (in: thermotogales)]
MKKIKILFLAILLLFFSTVFSEALIFKHCKVYYPTGYEKLAVIIGNKFETVRPYVVDFFDFDPGSINIFIEPNTIITNGYANYLQKNTIKIYTWHPSGIDYTYLPFDDWYTFLLIHEFTHIVTLKKLSGLKKITADLAIPYLPDFGKFSYESVTVFSESTYSNNSGRLNNPVISLELFNTFKDKLPNDRLMNDYRYGLVYYNANGGFFKYLIDNYGKEKVLSYLEHSMNNSTSYLEIMFGISFPYIFLAKIPYLVQDNFKTTFGHSYNDEIKIWLNSLPKSDNRGKIFYTGKNERIFKIEKENDKLYILTSKYGPVAGYFNHPIHQIVVINKKKEVLARYYINANDFKVENGNIYVLTYGNNTMEIWNLTQNKKIVSGKISAFDVYNNQLIYSIYDDSEDISTIYGLNTTYRIKGFIRNMAFNGKSLYFFIGNSLWEIENEKMKLIDNTSLKGAFLKKDGEKVYLTAKVKDKMQLLEVNESFIQLTENLNIIDGILLDDHIYYISYSKDGDGMAVYEIPKTLNKAKFKIENNKIFSLNFEYKKASKIEEYEYYFTPSVFIPIFITTNFLPEELSSGIDGFAVGSFFDFTNTKNDLIFAPFYLNFNINDSGTTTNYTYYGSAFGIISQDITEKFSITSLNFVDFNHSYFSGVSSFSLELLNKKISYDTSITFQVNQTSNYSYFDRWNFSSEISFDLFISKEYLSYGIGERNEISFDGTTLYFLPSINFYVLNIISQNKYLYGNLNFNTNYVNFYSTLINAFSFYKQAGFGISFSGTYNFKNYNSNNVFIPYLYCGHPKSNILYIQTGLLINLDGKISPFIGFGMYPHAIFAMF